MTNKGRRDALMLFGAMGVVSASAAMVQLVPHSKVGVAKIDLEQAFPDEFDGWHIDETTRAFVRPALDQGKLYGLYDQVLEQAYVNDKGERVMLSVVYGNEQAGALELHRPEVCYQYNGYRVLERQTATMALAGQSVSVINLQAELPGRFEPITYWIVIDGEPAAGPRAYHWRLVSFALRRQVPDGLLIRVSSINLDPKSAFDLHHRFADSMVRAMSAAHRAQVIGSALGS